MRSRLLFLCLFPLVGCTYSIDNGEPPRRLDAPSSTEPSPSTPGESSTPTSPAQNGGAKRAFVTSSTFTGDLASALETDLTSAAAADALCQAAADAALLGGTFQALIESPTEHAIARLASDGPWVTVKGQRVFNNKANLSTKPLVALDVDENGASVYGEAWTGIGDRPAANDQYASYAYCSDWSGSGSATVGNIGSMDQTWRSMTDSDGWGRRTCSTKAHLYCFEK